jgi:hypothetical protein
MERILSTLSRKPNGISEKEIKDSGWYDARSRVLHHLENDQVLQKLIKKFTVVDDQLKLTRSTRDMKINFHVLENAKGHRYAYARTQFVIDGKRKDFRKYLGLEKEVNLDHYRNADLTKLKDYFIDMLKNYLEYQD